MPQRTTGYGRHVRVQQSSGWADVLRGVVDRSHLVSGDQLSSMVDSLVRGLDLTADVYLVDLGQRVLSPVRPEGGDPVAVEIGDAGRAYQLGEIVAGAGEHGERLLWVPMLDGTERAGVLRIGLGEGVADDETLRRNVWSLSGDSSSSPSGPDSTASLRPRHSADWARRFSDTSTGVSRTTPPCSWWTGPPRPTPDSSPLSPDLRCWCH